MMENHGGDVCMILHKTGIFHSITMSGMVAAYCMIMHDSEIFNLVVTSGGRMLRLIQHFPLRKIVIEH